MAFVAIVERTSYASVPIQRGFATTIAKPIASFPGLPQRYNH